jgi:importin-9
MFYLRCSHLLETVQVLDTIHTSFPRTLVPYLKDLLTAALSHLCVLSPIFSHFYLSSVDTPPSTSEDEPISIPQLICPILDFVSAISREGKAKEWFESNNLNTLIASVFSYSQMTDENVSFIH